jgi:hypothetical protein
MMAQFSPLGILLGFTFIAALGSFFYSTLHVPPTSPLPIARVRRSAEARVKILVPLGAALSPEGAVELACHWETGKERELVLVYVVVVPYILSLDTPLPDLDQAASDALDLANLIAQRHHCPARMYIVRHRSAAAGVLQVAREEQVDAIMLEGGEPHTSGEWRRMSIELLRRATCEVIVDQVPIAAQPLSLNLPVGSATGA